MTPATLQAAPRSQRRHRAGDEIIDRGDTIIERPSRHDVIQAIMVECPDIGEDTAEGFLQMLEHALDYIRTNGQPLYHLNKNDLRDYHDVYKVVMPDGAGSKESPEVGVAHAEINRFLLGGGTRSLVHSQTADEARDCSVELHLN